MEAVKSKVDHSMGKLFTPETFIEKIHRTPKKKYASDDEKNPYGG